MSKNKIILPSEVDEGLDEYAQYAWLNIGDVRDLKIDNKMLHEEWDETNKIPELIVNTCRDPEYIHFFAKYILNIDLLPYQVVILQTLWFKPLPILIASRGGAKSWIIAVYLIIRAVLHQGCKIAVVGAGLRQSMVIFNYIQSIWDNAPILRDICGGKTAGPKKAIHMAEWHCGYSHMMFLPLGSGDKIRGQRANIVVGEEFASIPDTIFQTVVRGFAAVKSGGVHAGVVKAAQRKILKESGKDMLVEDDIQSAVKTMLNSNQIIMAGTASYQFNHFYKHFKFYKSIIENNGNLLEIKKDFPDTDLNQKINAKDYAIIRIPCEALPEGMMDDTILSQGKNTMDPIIFNMEYHTIFPSDSQGFFLASYLNNATCPLKIDGQDFSFVAKLGSKSTCVMGVDPASEDDKFTVCIIEFLGSIGDQQRRGIIYQWSTNRKIFEELKRDNLITDGIEDYHTFCIKHIRALYRRFNISMIVCDAGGGGVHVKEGLKDPDKMIMGDLPILDMDDDNNINKDGAKVLKMIEFSSDSWRKESHYGLRKDIMEKRLLFPEYDAADVELANIASDAIYDTLEDVYLEIIECKTETTMIKHSTTPGGTTEKWDVPKIRGLEADDVRKQLKRDRFTSLLLANWGARLLTADDPSFKTNSQVYKSAQRGSGGFGGNTPKTNIPVTYGKNGRKIYY